MTALLTEMQRAFSNSDLDTLIFDMGWDSGDFPRTKTDKIVAIIKQAKAHNRLKEMLSWCGQINSTFNYVEDEDVTKTLEWQLNRTLTVVRELARGKVLKLPNGFTIAMGDDLSIGYAMYRSSGELLLSGLATLELKDLNNVLNEHNIVIL